MVNCFSSIFPRPSSSSLSAASIHESTPLLFEEKQHRASPSKVDTTSRLAALRCEMDKLAISVYIVPTADQHGSEYVGVRDRRREFITGFSGSAGVAVVLKESALLFTDSRYFVAAANELDDNWKLVKVLARADSWEEYLTTLPIGTKVGLDPRFCDYRTIKPLLARLTLLDITLVFSRDNLVDRIWHDQPQSSTAPIVTHPIKFSGKSAIDKIADLRSFLSNPSSCYLVTSLNNIAWILNLRGADIEFNPVFAAYLVVGRTSLTLFVEAEKVGSEVRSVIEQDLGGAIKSYDDVWKFVRDTGGSIVADAAVSWAFVEAVGRDRLTIVRSPIDLAEAIKNPVEIEGMKRAYMRDGAAWVRWAAWLDELMKSGGEINEWDAAEELTKYRALGKYFNGLAYDNISATNENAALPHYAPTALQSRVIDRSSPYLNDSGAQYLDGTIDTTRTVHFGKPSSEQRLAFTRALQGHIAIDTCVFPTGTTGFQIDVLARAPLWRDGLNYLHGTGHGIGSDLSVHEGPHGIGPSIIFNDTALRPGMCSSNEPAFYEVGKFGIRIESVVFVKEVQTRRQFGSQPWLRFERFTMVPIQSSFVDFKLLSKFDKRWLKCHNARCCEVLAPFLKKDKRARKYLARQ